MKYSYQISGYGKGRRRPNKRDIVTTMGITKKINSSFRKIAKDLSHRYEGFYRSEFIPSDLVEIFLLNYEHFSKVIEKSLETESIWNEDRKLELRSKLITLTFTKKTYEILKKVVRELAKKHKGAIGRRFTNADLIEILVLKYPNFSTGIEKLLNIKKTVDSF